MSVLRTAEGGDAARLAKLNATVSEYPWSAQQFNFDAEEIWLLEQGHNLQGFIVVSQVMEVASILNVAVHPSCQRSGLASKLLTTALRSVISHGAVRCVLEVRSSNREAGALYKRFGFEIDTVRKNYYPALIGREDAILMSKNLLIRTDTGSHQ